MKKRNKKFVVGTAIFFEAALIISLSLFFFSGVFAGIGEDNVTVITQLDIGNVYPEVSVVSLQNDQATVSLTPANTTKITCEALVIDYNGDSDINSVNATFFDTVASSPGDTDDNNYHYTNSSCSVEPNFGSWNGHTDDAYTSLANCTFEVEYYANPQTWNCSATVSDKFGWTDNKDDSITVSELLALGLPDTIYYGEVNATYVSDENITNVTNYGNVALNLSLEGYAQTKGDGYAMNCSLGSSGYIDVNYEKYNLSSSTLGEISLTEFESTYENLTSSSIVKSFNLASRQNDISNEAIGQTYWRIYVPLGVAGTCQGNIIFGATQAPGN
jgi:hypothetical protein